MTVITCTLIACASIAQYDQASYEHATAAKVDALLVVAKATDSYDNHRQEIDALNVELEKAYQYDKGRPLNEITVKLWDRLRDPNGALLGKFLMEWQNQGKLAQVYVAEREKQISQGFDYIIQLESGKIKPSQVPE